MLEDGEGNSMRGTVRALRTGPTGAPLADIDVEKGSWRTMGRIITEQINADPAEADRLRQARQSARRTPPESWREDWDSPEDGVYDD